MTEVQSLPCLLQPSSIMSDKERFTENDFCLHQPSTGNFADLNTDHSGGVLIDQSSVYYFRHLIKKYTKQMGEDLGTNHVCSGGLQQYLIKSNLRQEKERRDDEMFRQRQSKFESLPLDVRLHIFSFLTATELCRASLVCRSWYDITEDNLLWSPLLERDVNRWEIIGSNTNPNIYKEVESEWTSKEIYLRCSPEVNHMMHQQNALFNNLSSMLRYFFPKKIPMLAMFGPGLESKTSGLVRSMMNSSLFTQIGLFPGKFDGVGGGITMKCPSGSGPQFHLSILYSASKKEREQTNRDRSQNHRMLRERQDEEGSFELVQAVQDFCKTVDGFVYVVDSTASAPAVESGISELLAMVSERWSATHVPVLVLSTTVSESDDALSCFNVSERLNLNQLNRPWQVRSVNLEKQSKLVDAFQWLVEQSQRKY